MRNKVAVFSGLIFAFGLHEAQACHRFARWYYPWPQQCGTHAVAYKRIYTGPPDLPTPPVKDVNLEIPLPDVGFTPCPPMPDESAGRILLRATLGEAHER